MKIVAQIICYILALLPIAGKLIMPVIWQCIFEQLWRRSAA